MSRNAQTVREVHAELTGAGSPFAMAECAFRQDLRAWKNGPQTLQDVLAAAGRFDEREFLVDGAARITYGAFRRAVSALADDFRKRGIGRGKVVVLIMPNQAEWIVAWFAAACTGAIIAPVNPAATRDELAHMVVLAGASLVVCASERLARVAEILPYLPVRPELIVVRSPDAPPDADRLEDILGEIEAWDRLPPPKPFDNAEPDAGAMIFFTSGTTNAAKGVLLSHRSCAYSVFHAAFRNARRFRLSGEAPPEPDVMKAPQQVLLLPIPLFHVSGSLNPVLPLIMRGGRIILMRFWSPELAIRLIERERVNIVGGIPIVAEQILNHASFARYDHSSLGQVIYGGAPAVPQLAGRLRDHGISPGQNYGMTETGGAVLGHVGPEYLARPASCGLPAPTHDVRIVDADGKVLLAGQTGELQIRGPQVMLGYWRDPDLTAQTMVDGWLRTGDIAFIDDDGYCFIVDRAKDMIISAGENVYCSEIESTLAAHPAVLEVAALGLPHERFGEQPVAVVVARDGIAVTEEALRAFAARTLTNIKVPARILVSAVPLPRNDAGKVLKLPLRGLFS